jgi:predicted amidohydrolase YtcJ
MRFCCCSSGYIGPKRSPDEYIYSPVSDSAVLQAHGVDAAAVRELGPQQFLLPGFIDTHAHAPQYQVQKAVVLWNDVKPRYMWMLVFAQHSWI